jgi:single-strand DNA-binding protein
MDINSIIIAGNLTDEPTVRTAEGGTVVGKFRIASQRPKKDGEDAGADFVDITVFGQQATNCHRYLAKGRKVIVKGRLHFSEYEVDGARRQRYEITADQFGGVQFLGGKPAEDGATEQAPEPEAALAA